MKKNAGLFLVGLNNSAHRFAQPFTDLLESGEVKLARLKKEVAEGTYYVPALVIAEKCLPPSRRYSFHSTDCQLPPE